MKKNDFKFGKGSSAIVITAVCIVTFLLVAYVGVSLTSKGTFSANENSGIFNFWDYEFVESEGNTGFKCYVNPSRKIAEIVYVLGTEDTVPYGVLTAIDPRRFIVTGDKISGFDLSGWDIGRDGPSYRMYFTEDALKSPNSWECKLTDDLTDDSNYMCDNYGQVAYVPLCRKYTSDSSDGNLILSSAANASKVYCGWTGYYLYTLDTLSENSTCMKMPDGKTTSFAPMSSGKTVDGVEMCNPETHTVVELTSCNSSGTCYDYVVYERGSFEHCPVTFDENTTISFAPRGYTWSSLKAADDPDCKLRVCRKCTKNGNFAESAIPEKTSFYGERSCPEGYSEDEKYETCAKECYICRNGIEDTIENVFIDVACSTLFAGAAYDEKRGDSYCANGGGTSPGTDPGTTPGGTTTKKTCYKCTADSTTPITGEYETCTGDWSETVPTCSKTCKYCSNGDEKTNSSVPKLKNCSEFNSSYHEVDETLNCSGGGTTPGTDPGTTPFDPSQCTYTYKSFFENLDLMYIEKSNSACSCENISNSDEWDEYGMYEGGDPSFMTCINNSMKNKITNGYKYLLGNLKSCYTSEGFVKSSDGKSCIRCDDGYELSNNQCVKKSGGTTPGGTTTKKTCYKCTNDAIVDSEFDSCDSNDGWFESEPRCCWTCNGINKTRVGVPSSQACTDFAGYTNTRDALTCEHKCWRCNGNTAEQVRVELGKECSVAGQEKGQTFVDKESDLNCSGGNTETPSVEVRAADSDTTTVQATNEVSKIVDKIAEGETVSGVDSNLKSKINNAIDNNKAIVVEVEKSAVDESNITSDANKVKETISSNEKVAVYYDIDVAIKVDNQKIGNVTELAKGITVTVPIPANLPAVASGYGREYRIISVHNGTAKVITPTVSGSSLSFTTDRFSTYAVVYQDVVKNGSSGNSSSSSSGSSQNDVDNPKTGSSLILIAWMIGFVAICYAVYYYTVVKVKD